MGHCELFEGGLSLNGTVCRSRLGGIRASSEYTWLHLLFCSDVPQVQLCQDVGLYEPSDLGAEHRQLLALLLVSSACVEPARLLTARNGHTWMYWLRGSVERWSVDC